MQTITIVSGFGRCGSSLVMQMLAAGGMDVAGQAPAYEDPAGSITNSATFGAWAAANPGRVAKVLDPHSCAPMPKLDCRVIWCSRDHHEQAQSQIKFLRILMGLPVGRAEVRAFERSYVDDKLKAIRALLRTGCKSILDVRFENTITRPADVAKELAAFCAIPTANEPAMAAVVLKRSSLCAPDLSIELNLVKT